MAVKIPLFSLKVWKNAPKGGKKAHGGGGQNHKIANNSTNMSIWSLKIGQTWKQLVQTFYNTFQALYSGQNSFI